MKTCKTLFLLLFLSASFVCLGQKNSKLLQLKRNNITLHYSKNIAQPEVNQYICRVEKAISYYYELMGGNEIKLDMYVLKKEDWKGNAYVPMYGMPHAAKGKLIMAYDDNPLWANVLPKEEQVSKKEYANFKKIYTDRNGNVSAKVFWDLLSIHELGHIVANANEVYIPKYWFNEFFANYFLHAYIAKYEDHLLDQLIKIPEINGKLLAGEKFTSLDEFENNYGSKMTGKNYVWYQFNIQQIVKQVYDQVGDEPLKRIFAEFKGNTQQFNSSDEFIVYIEKNISPLIADYFKKF